MSRRHVRRLVLALVCGVAALPLAPAATAVGDATPGSLRPKAGRSTATIQASADAYVDSRSPRSTYGSATRLRADASPLRRAYVRFALPGGAAVERARLSVFVMDGSRTGFEVRGVASTPAWSEAGLTFAGAPAVDAAPVATSGAVRAGTWTTVDVTSLVARADADVTVALTARAAEIALGARESGLGPRLVVERQVSAPPPPPPAPPPPPPAAAPSRFGLASGGTIEWASEAELARELDGYSALGAGWMRFDVKWSVVERSRGSFDWTNYDRVIGAANARGLKVVANLAYTPDWARPAGATDDKYAPSDAADYARFARAAVARYAPLGVKHFEIWNEPNIVVFWKPAPDPARYTALLRQAYAAMKQVDSSITVLAGAFSPAGGYHDPACNGQPSRDINAIDFLERMYASGAAGSFDALAHHPYSGSAEPSGTHRCNAWNQMVGTSPSLRSVMVANGDAGKTIWATEFGSEADKLGEQAQAAQIDDAMRLWRTYPWAGQLMVFAYKQTLEGFNLVRLDWSPRPAWYAFQSAARA